MSKLKKLVIVLAILVIAFPATVFGYLWFKLDEMRDPDLNGSLSDNEYNNERGITNVLLIGTDGRPGDKNSRSDAMMILTIDNNNKSLKLTSLARDSYVDIPGHGSQKLTHAYVYGQDSLLIETIEDNFEIDIQHYAAVDFFSFMDVIDALGGVTVDVKENEINELNKFIPETYKWHDSPDKGSLEYINTSGPQKLNGYQTLAFSRIRKNDSAVERDRRQREVIEGLVQGVKDLSVTKYPGLIDTILPHVKTNMTPGNIITLATKILGMGNLDMKQLEFPIDDGINGEGGIVGNAGWVLKFTPESLDILHDFIFNDIMYDK